MKHIQHEIDELPELAGRLDNQGEGATFLVQVSGGADSIATLLHCLELYPHARFVMQHQAIWMDWHSTFPYLRNLEKRLNIPLKIIQAIYVERLRTFKNGRPAEKQLSMELIEIEDDRQLPYSRDEAAERLNTDPAKTIAGVIDLAEYRGKPPTAGIRYCTSYFKKAAAEKWIRLNRLALGQNAVNVLGIRRMESARRSKEPVGRLRKAVSTAHWSCWDFHPIINWSKGDAFDMLKRHGIEPHIAYKAQGMNMVGEIQEGGPRCSCVGCIFSHHNHLARAVTSMVGVSPDDTAHAQEVVHRLLDFQQTSEMSWQQSGEAGFNQVAAAIGRGPFSKPVKVPKINLEL